MIAVGTRVTSRPPHRSVRAQFGHTAPTSGMERHVAIFTRRAVCVPAPVTREPGTVPGACFAGSHSPRPPPLAPPAPQRIAPPCSSASQLLWRSSDSPCPCIIGYGSSPSRCGPDRQRAAGRTWDLPVPAQGASAHASVYDHAGPSGRSRYRAHPCCLPSAERRRRPGRGYFRGSMAGLCAPLSTLRRCPRGQLRMPRGRCGSLLLHRDGLAPSTPCRSPGALCFSPNSRHQAVRFRCPLCATSRHQPRLFESLEPFSVPEISTDFIQPILGKSDYEISLQCRERYIRPTIAPVGGSKGGASWHDQPTPTKISRRDIEMCLIWKIGEPTHRHR